MTAATEEPTGPSIVVTGGGEPSAEELAAIVVALTPVVVEEGDQDGGRDDVPRGWNRAALIEGVGGRPSASLPDLVSGRFGLGHIGDPTLHA